jgi:RimJ/RimL family protein N-acetyltransferase
MWSSGDVVAVRELWKGRVWTARPWIVVRDAPDELVLWIPKGTPTRVHEGSGIPRDEWELVDGVRGESMLRVARPGELHSTMLFRRGEHGLEWYVNLERPLRRTRLGFDYLDRELDLLARPDGTWELLDEDELEEALATGAIDDVEAARMRAEAERVAAEWPFPTGWEDWRPDPAWELPRLPDGWDEIPWPVLRTERLELRPLDECDLPWYAELRARDGFDRDSAALRHSEALSHWALHGFGKFAVLLAGEPAGLITLNHAGDGLEGIAPDEIDLGWYVLPHLFGREIAPEAARAVLAWLREVGIGPVVAYIRLGNAASVRVAEKLGLRRDADGSARDGAPVTVYRDAS